MAVALEFLNLVIPIEKIEQHYPGGWGRYLDDHKNLIGRRIWFDDYLLRDGAMNPKDMSDFIDEWVGLVQNANNALQLEKPPPEAAATPAACTSVHCPSRAGARVGGWVLEGVLLVGHALQVTGHSD